MISKQYSVISRCLLVRAFHSISVSPSTDGFGGAEGEPDISRHPVVVVSVVVALVIGESARIVGVRDMLVLVHVVRQVALRHHVWHGLWREGPPFLRWRSRDGRPKSVFRVGSVHNSSDVSIRLYHTILPCNKNQFKKKYNR